MFYYGCILSDPKNNKDEILGYYVIWYWAFCAIFDLRQLRWSRTKSRCSLSNTKHLLQMIYIYIYIYIYMFLNMFSVVSSIQNSVNLILYWKNINWHWFQKQLPRILLQKNCLSRNFILKKHELCRRCFTCLFYRNFSENLFYRIHATICCSSFLYWYQFVILTKQVSPNRHLSVLRN